MVLLPIGEWGSLRLKFKYLHDLIMPEAEYSPLKELILDSNLDVVRTLSEVCHPERMPLATSLLRIFRFEKKEADLLSSLNHLEVEKEEEKTSTLFRGASLTTCLMDLYMKSVCTEFLHTAIFPTIHRIIESRQSCELNPNKIESSSEACANAEFLLQILDGITESIFMSSEACPRTLRYICYCLQRTVMAKWPNERFVKTRAVSGFIFLRLLCPAILNPRLFNLLSESPPPAANRSLIMIAKCLQNLANLVEFGIKECYMEVVNPFIIKNKERMVVFLDHLSSVREKPYPDEERVKGDPARDLANIHHLCETHLEELKAYGNIKIIKSLIIVTEMGEIIMAVLVGGESYALSSNHQKKTIVFVKLTDSSLRALEEYLGNSKSRQNHQNNLPGLHHKPTIEFSQNSGKICIPRNSNGDKSTFRFNVSSINESHGPQGSFECLQSHKPSSTLESIGPLQEKITVNASDDTYTRFGQKMFLTKYHLSSVIKNHIPSSSNTSNISSSISLSRHLNNSAPSTLNSRIASSRSASPSTTLAPTHPIMDRKQQSSGSFSKSANPPGLPNISRRPLRERLNSRLHRDGLRDKDKKCINQVIKQVSVMKDNTYSLLRHLWNDVSEDWPYYTDQEKATFRRRKPQNLTPPVSDGGSSTCSSGHSPSSTNPASPARSFPFDNDLNSKKKRVSNYQRPPPQQAASHLPRQLQPRKASTPEGMVIEDASTKTNNWLNNRPIDFNRTQSSESTNPIQPADKPLPRDFITSFTKIKDKTQRANYKVEFNKNYIRYRELHSQLEKVSKRFAQSEEQLRSIIRTEEKGEARKKIKEIEHDYRNTNNDPVYVRTREEFKIFT
ncbi:RASA1 [Lepeophtheirus salmonis]|uniref:RASA1 n=1 Tax=Lepeophtheirus salmonis TaxID=72036 RepID=A0A7R8HCM9_LEPSM|nr:RASA1 [Lepeophtheirus salmonis]CAF3008045.1 RASA1 [Lepeophtheirus salmonis]